MDGDVYDEMEADTPLIWAARQGHEEIVRILLDAGADITLESEYRTVVQAAIEGGSMGCLQALLDHEDIFKVLNSPYIRCDDDDDDRSTLVDMAAERERLDMTLALLKKGAKEGPHLRYPPCATLVRALKECQVNTL